MSYSIEDPLTVEDEDRLEISGSCSVDPDMNAYDTDDLLALGMHGTLWFSFPDSLNLSPAALERAKKELQSRYSRGQRMSSMLPIKEREELSLEQGSRRRAVSLCLTKIEQGVRLERIARTWVQNEEAFTYEEADLRIEEGHPDLSRIFEISQGFGKPTRELSPSRQMIRAISTGARVAIAHTLQGQPAIFRDKAEDHWHYSTAYKDGNTEAPISTQLRDYAAIVNLRILASPENEPPYSVEELKELCERLNMKDKKEQKKAHIGLSEARKFLDEPRPEHVKPLYELCNRNWKLIDILYDLLRKGNKIRKVKNHHPKGVKDHFYTEAQLEAIADYLRRYGVPQQS